MRFSEALLHREFADAWGRTIEANKRGFGIGRAPTTELEPGLERTIRYFKDPATTA
jgi:hypothetical protein